MYKAVLLISVWLVFGVFDIAAQEAEITEIPQSSDLTVEMNPVEEAETLVAEARAVQQESLGIVNTLLSAIQVGGVIIAVLAAIGTAFGIYNISQVNEKTSRLNRKLREVNKKIDELEKLKYDLEKDRSELAEIKDLPMQVEDKIKEQVEQSNKQMQALSLVQFAIRQTDVGNRGAALRTLERAHMRDRTNPVIQFFYGEVCVRQGDYARGVRYLEQARLTGDMPDADATLAYAYRMQGDDNKNEQKRLYSKSESIYTELETKYPELLDITGESVYGALAGLYRRQNRIREAVETYTRIAKVTPGSSYPLNNLGLLHFEYANEDFASLQTGKMCFKKSRQKASSAVQAESADFWRLFDLVTAEIALEEASWETVKLRIDEAFDYRPISDDVEKLVEGLEQLQRSPYSPQLVEKALTYVKENKMTSVK